MLLLLLWRIALGYLYSSYSLTKRTIPLLSAPLPQEIAKSEKEFNMEQINTLHRAFISINELPDEVLIWAQKGSAHHPVRLCSAGG